MLHPSGTTQEERRHHQGCEKMRTIHCLTLYFSGHEHKYGDVLFGARVVARSLQTVGRYARRSRLAGRQKLLAANVIVFMLMTT
jgi:hypothetical protein